MRTKISKQRKQKLRKTMTEKRPTAMALFALAIAQELDETGQILSLPELRRLAKETDAEI